MTAIRKQMKQLALPLGIIALLIILFANRLALSNLILGRGDAYLYFYPYWTAAAAALKAGRIPLWNPEIFMGAPFAANSQIGFFYPLNWPFWWLLPAPYAVSASLVLHLIIAGWGAYFCARRVWELLPTAAGLAAVLFTLGGYITAQVEHVNQVQGMAWLPWLFLVVRPELPPRRRLLATALLLALQLSAGHTQTTFITGTGVGFWLLLRLLWPDGATRPRWTRLLPGLAPVAAGAVLALALAAIQLLPTLELTGQSSRAGGLSLNEVLSFSLHPLLLGRALLPGYGEAPFAEYAAFMPLSALLLAGVGMWSWRRNRMAREALLLLLFALFLALGQFNPFNYLLARLPGFDLFRVPARWLLLYTLAVAILAGLGWQGLASVTWRDYRRPLLWSSGGLIVLIGWAFLAVPLSRFIPVGPESPAVLPGWLSAAAWLIELSLFWLLISRSQLASTWRQGGLLALMGVVLFLGTRSLAYNAHVTTPDVYFQLRAPIARLQALTTGQAPAGRYLSQSQIFFDLGDEAELDAIYADQLDEAAMWSLIVATKQKEVIAPNLSLVYGLSAVDGFDGGILPLANYTAATAALLPEGFRSTDGRLREYISAVPDDRWLDLYGVQFLITDKVGDEWREAEGLNVFYDRKHEVALAPGELTAVGYLPPYEATGLRLLALGGPPTVQAVDQDGGSMALTLRQVGADQFQVDFAEPLKPATIQLQNENAAPLTIIGLALIDERDVTFQTLVPGAFRLLYSGDVKIYENMDVLPRAFLTTAWEQAEAGIGPASLALVDLAGLTDSGSGRIGQVTIQHYGPELIRLRTQATEPSLLVVSDAHFPGWRVELDGQAAELHLVAGLFRGVEVPAGDHEIIMRYLPNSFRWGRAISVIALALFMLGCLSLVGPAAVLDSQR